MVGHVDVPRLAQIARVETSLGGVGGIEPAALERARKHAHRDAAGALTSRRRRAFAPRRSVSGSVRSVLASFLLRAPSLVRPPPSRDADVDLLPLREPPRDAFRRGESVGGGGDGEVRAVESSPVRDGSRRRKRAQFHARRHAERGARAAARPPHLPRPSRERSFVLVLGGGCRGGFRLGFRGGLESVDASVGGDDVELEDALHGEPSAPGESADAAHEHGSDADAGEDASGDGEAVRGGALAELAE